MPKATQKEVLCNVAKKPQHTKLLLNIPLTCECVVCYVYPSGMHTVFFISSSWRLVFVLLGLSKQTQKESKSNTLP